MTNPIESNGNIIVTNYGATLRLVCHDIQYSFALTRFFGDGAVAIKHCLGREMTYTSPGKGRMFTRENLMISDGLIIEVDDAALVGHIKICIESIEIRSDTTSIQYSYRWTPYVAQDPQFKERVGVHFSTRARLINQLGEQLIKSEGVALLELVKNAYDADATTCTVELQHLSNVKEAILTIEDDGSGMAPEIVENVWFQLGTSYKADLVASGVTRTPKFGRLRLGEKGIGRLGVHRLGQTFELITKSASSPYEVHAFVDWSHVDGTKMIEELPVVCEKRAPEVFKNGKTGTHLIITDFREPWNRRMLINAVRSLMSLNSPFESESTFRVDINVCGEEEKKWLRGIVDYESIKSASLYEFDICMEGDRIVDFKYSFTPWDTMQRVGRRDVRWDQSYALSQMMSLASEDGFDLPRSSSISKCQPISLEGIGRVRFRGKVFDLNSKVLNLGVPDRKGLKEYLKANAGVKVFRDNMRVLDYGEPGNDWLDLNGRKFKRASEHISNSAILAAVYLDRGESFALQEKANREGFLENEAYLRLCKALCYCMDRIDNEWREDRDRLYHAYLPRGRSDAVLVQTPIDELRKLVGSAKGLTESERVGLMDCVDRIDLEFHEVTDTLMRSAGAGLNLIMVLHQMEKIIDELKASSRSRDFGKGALEQIKLLDELIHGYSILIKNSEKQQRSLSSIVEQAIFNVSFRLESHGIKICNECANIQDDKAICTKNHALNVLMNLFDNAIWWLGYAKTLNPEIYISLSDCFKGYVTVVFADNGPGFTRSTQELVKPFVSDKPGGSGIGLHLSNVIMNSLGGDLKFPPADVVGVPDRFKKGAIIAILFAKKGGE